MQGRYGCVADELKVRDNGGKKKKSSKALQGHIKRVCKISGSLKNGVDILDSKIFWGYMLEPACDELWCYHPVSLATCNEIIPATYPWYIRTPEKGLKEVQKEKQEEKEGGKNNGTKQAFAQGAGRVPKGQVSCLLVRSVL